MKAIIGLLFLMTAWSFGLGSIILFFRGEFGAMIAGALFAWIAGAIGKGIIASGRALTEYN